MTALLYVVAGLALLWALAYFHVPLLLASAIVAAGLGVLTWAHYADAPALLVALWAVFLILALPLNLPPLRRRLVSDRVFDLFRELLPPVSATEAAAIESGTVWWEAEFFRGRPRWSRLFDVPPPTLSVEERAFLDGPVEELCRMLDDWEIRQRQDLPPDVWEFLRRERF